MVVFVYNNLIANLRLIMTGSSSPDEEREEGGSETRQSLSLSLEVSVSLTVARRDERAPSHRVLSGANSGRETQYLTTALCTLT